MNAILDINQLRQTSMTPRLNDDQRRGPSSNDRTLDALAALPPADDSEAEVPETALELTALDVERLQALAADVSTARDSLTRAEADLAVADRSARYLPTLERKAGSVAAEAFRGGQDAKAAVKGIAADIEDAKTAVMALPALTLAVEQARDQFHRARGSLSGATVKAIQQMQLRASQRYAELALEVTRCIACIDGAILALPGRMQAEMASAWHAHVMADLSLPAMPPSLRVNNQGVVAMWFRDSLLRAQHERLTHHSTAAAGHLQAQLRDAIAPAGMSVRSLLG